MSGNKSKNTIPLNPSESEDLFDILYKLHYPFLLKIAQSYIPSKEDAEEVLQDAFMKVWRKKDTLNSDDNITGYLYRIVKNTCLDFLRSKKHTLSLETNLLQQKNLLNYNALSNETASHIIEKELQKKIEESIALLPKKCQLIFIKSRFEGLKHKEISAEMNISTKTIENHITKALRHLRIHLKDFLPFL
ncbi:RNA polymerase sigma-70 factor [Snuella sedimenti]|uniref:RNA polymerase sigma-70 factor n=1 Tax=Snuella sedimenti TaxID=2798802 RepID=A0A8J7IGB8_9FLAO|nr:RNA polymerase sigma-70 factor [Snuella sedimenti]MBJ6368972.1 RNA polymerase sigma-70 factor [Snuella sedimenti]